MSGLFGKVLGEQLVQAGIATEKQLEKAKEQPAHKGYKKKTGGKRKGKGKRAAPVAKADTGKIEVTENTLTRQVSKKAKANELIKANLVVDMAASEIFNFAVNGKLRQITVTPEQATKIANGELAIIKTDVTRDPYVLIPAAAAVQLRDLQPNRILAFFDEPEATDDNSTE